jgi:hypothetical protein
MPCTRPRHHTPAPLISHQNVTAVGRPPPTTTRCDRGGPAITYHHPPPLAVNAVSRPSPQVGHPHTAGCCLPPRPIQDPFTAEDPSVFISRRVPSRPHPPPGLFTRARCIRPPSPCPIQDHPGSSTEPAVFVIPHRVPSRLHPLPGLFSRALGICGGPPSPTTTLRQCHVTLPNTIDDDAAHQTHARSARPPIPKRLRCVTR